MKKLFNVVSLVLMLSMILTAVVFADDVINDVAVDLEGNKILVAEVDEVVTVGFKVIATGDPPPTTGGDTPGCNVSGDAKATASVVKHDDVNDDVIADPSTFSIDKCDEYFYVDFSSSEVGEYTISLSVSGGRTVQQSTPQYDVSETFFTFIVEEATPVDETPPVASPTQIPVANEHGWNNESVTVYWNWADEEGGSGIDPDNCTMTTVAETEGEYNVTATCKDLAGNEGSASYPVKIDKTAPFASPTQDPLANANGWNKTDVVVTWNWADALSGLDVPTCALTTTATTEGEYGVTATCKDKAGNTGTATYGVKIDKTAPTITWSNGPEGGETYYFLFVPAEPTCTAVDTLSGPDGCTVTGYSASIGSHTMTATAYDKAGNKTIETRSYTVEAWTLTGFYRPVEMGSVWNTIRGGQTVPLKFNVFYGPDGDQTELTDVAVVQGFSVQFVTCDALGTSAEDAVDFTTTGGTSLRYDFTEGQFIQNWKTPNMRNKCFMVTMTTIDGSSLSAYFKTK